MIFRRGVTLPPMLSTGHETDSDAGNIADNDSLASFLSSVQMTNTELDLTDHIPTRDTGLVSRDNREQEFDTVSYQSANTFSNITTPTNSRKNSEKQPR